MKTTAIKLTDKKLNKLKGDNLLINRVIDCIIDRTESERIHFINDTINNGCISGTVGELIYYSDTTKFYNEFKAEIFDMATEQAEEIGYKNVMELFASLNGIKDVGSIDQLENLLAWYGFEETIRNIAYKLGIEI